MKQYHKTICPLDCPDTCGLIATTESGKIMALKGDPAHPETNGFICSKMRRYPERFHSEERIMFPQKRVGVKGAGKFQRISWDEAWEIMTDQITRIKKQHGGEAILPYSYAGNMGAINRWAGYPVFHKLGASQLLHTVCATAAGDGWEAHCGDLPGANPASAAESDLTILWGINVKTTNVHFWPHVQKSRRKGGKLVVIDPYRNKTAKAADYYFPVAPGGDSALVLALIKLMIQFKTFNAKYIHSFTENFESFKEYVETIKWSDLEQRSGLIGDEINQLYLLLIKNPKTFIRIGMGLTRNTTGAMSIRTITALAAVLGLFENKSGQGVLLSSGAFQGDKNKLKSPDLMQKPTRKINMVQLGNALLMKEKPIHLLFIYNSNPLSIAPDSSKVRAGLGREDLFTILHEQVLTPTTKYADLLLPATTFLENSDFHTAYGHFYCGRIKPAIEVQGECISNFNLFQTLAQKLGFKEAIFKQSVDDRIVDYLETLKGLPEDFSLEKFTSGNYIQSKLVDIHAFIKATGWKYQFESKIAEPKLPQLLLSKEFDDDKMQSQFPFYLITPPCNQLLNSTFGEMYQAEIGTVLINPHDASIFNIQTDQIVKIENSRGFTIRKAVVSEDTQSGLLVAEGVYWENESSKNTCINDITSQQTTDLGEGGTFHESLVRIVKYEESSE